MGNKTACHPNKRSSSRDLLSQPTQAFKYHAVARDTSGSILSNQNVSFQISILQGSETGPDVYIETHAVVTNDLGLVSLDIGNGTIVSGDFSIIDWGGDSFFLNIEMDETGGSNYKQIGVSQLMSVPYALHAGTLDDGDWIVSGNDMYSNVSGNVGIGNSNPEIPIDGSGTYDLLKINTAASLTAFIVESSGEVGIGTDSPTYKLVVNGEAAKPGGGSWLTWSDKRLKDIHGDYKKGLDEIMKLHPVVYSYKKDTPQNLPSDKEYTGLIAQEVEKVVPTMITEKEVNNIQDFKELDPNELTYMLINAVKELKVENEDLQKRIKKLENK